MVSTDEGRSGGDRSRRPGRSRLLRLLLISGGLLGAGVLAAAVAFYLTFVADLPDIESVEDYRPPLASILLDRNGERVGEFFNERRRLLPLTEVPQHVVRAFVAAEDSHFFEHSGIDYPSILRAAWANLRAGGEIVQGASTITQQTVKGLLLSPERKFRRKVREIILARDIEQRLTKQEILYLYLNQIYFGSGAYGIREAARSYYGKEVAELTVGEAAQLAGLPKAPTSYSPRRNPERAEQRRLYVLSRMRDEGFITSDLYDEAVAERPALSERQWLDAYSDSAYFAEQVRRYLFEELGGEAVLDGGLVIETTVDRKLQSAGVAALRQGLEDLDRRQGYRGAERKVEAKEIAETLIALAEENGLAPKTEAGDDEAREETDDAPDAGSDGSDGSEEARLRAALAKGPLRGLVLEVDRAADTARIAFGPTGAGTVRLSDVAWAREPNPDLLPRPVKSIEEVFAPGDVALFDAIESDPKDESAELRLTLRQRPLVQGALLSVDVRSGDVLALIGGYDYQESQFDRVTQARRQPGSAFKPLVYGAALSLASDNGGPRYTPASIIHDRPKVYQDRQTGFVWKPKNYGRAFYGPITLRRALAKSINTAAVHLCEEVGVGNVIRYARRLGIESPLEPSLGLALGTSGVSLLELTRAYAVFPAGGQRVVPRFIRRVTDREGNVLLENVTLGSSLEDLDASAEAELELDVAAGPEGLEEAPSPIRAERVQLIPEEEAYLVSDMLRAVVDEGTGRRVKALGRPLAGKTGTTNDQADAWFLGFSPEIATGVWVGFDEIRFLGAGETGSRAASPIWIDYMRTALADQPKRDFALPESIVFARIDRETGLLASRNSTETVFQAFIAGTEPTETAQNRRTTQDALRNLREDSLSTEEAVRLMKRDAF